MEEFKTQIEALQGVVDKQTKEIADLRENLLKLRRSLLLPPHLSAQGNEFESCKLLLESPYWPAAVDPSLICNISSDQDKEDRAEGVLDLVIDMPLENLKFLDFGCGEGHVVHRSKLQKPKLSIGYDIERFDKWDSWPAEEGVRFTTNWDEVKENGPYNAILMYDVLDHIKGDESVLIGEICKIKNVLAPYGKIYIRCHPWCSRHGTHLYHKINKAYIHLVFSEEELEQMGYKGVWTRKLIHTTYDYERIFKGYNSLSINDKAGSGAWTEVQPINLRILRGAHVQEEPIEPFFWDTHVIANRIRKHWPAWDNMRAGIRHQFVDYVLG